ncbi:MAG TPA: 16S rRNA (cytidine(1402)-2'-O)-methyltransferase [Candidatus Mcinerneyibacteriales bacterium]|nr:16S rRNA (cytidine(1402)-2'-O)-methyltransferase [Candidatus Mcinerneyibacteriales bacterium]
MPGTLFIVATPIGNLGDFSPRGVETLQSVHTIAAEDPAQSAVLLKKFNIKAAMIRYNEGNKESAVPRIMGLLKAGHLVAYISEAGTPCISDPGLNLVRQAAEEGYPVVPVPGPTAAMALLSASGLPTDRFIFMGFAPKKEGELARFREFLESWPYTAVCYVSPHHMKEFVAMLESLSHNPDIVVGRELTKIHEEIIRGRAHEIGPRILSNVRGEFTVAIAGNREERETNETLIVSKGEELMKKFSLKDTASILSVIYDLTKNRVYDMLLKSREGK